jgi:uncharacterized protein
MDLEICGRKDLADYFLDAYRRRADDPAPRSLMDFYVAYRAVVRAKVDCVCYGQGHPEAATDDVRRDLQGMGAITGRVGDLDAGLYAPENVAVVYDEVLRRARVILCSGSSVILDGTWRDAGQRQKARKLAAEAAVPVVELTCSVPQGEATARIEGRTGSSSEATPEIAEALRPHGGESHYGHPIDTSHPVAETVAEARQICRLAV